ncbi:MAG TPA: hypothetical protein ENK85_09895 [Saprospiraceae bacterium]|nr:hypothetical protein [Saprospiraceae bacterium]
MKSFIPIFFVLLLANVSGVAQTPEPIPSMTRVLAMNPSAKKEYQSHQGRSIKKDPELRRFMTDISPGQWGDKPKSLFFVA